MRQSIPHPGFINVSRFSPFCIIQHLEAIFVLQRLLIGGRLAEGPKVFQGYGLEGYSRIFTVVRFYEYTFLSYQASPLPAPYRGISIRTAHKRLCGL